MLFPTVDFAVFFIVVFTGNWLLRPYKRTWRWFIFLSSCVFYVDVFSKDHNPGLEAVPPLLVFGVFALAATFLIRAVSTSEEPGGDRPDLSIAVAGVIAVAFLIVNIVISRLLPDNNQLFFRYLLLLLGFVFVNQAAARAVYASLGEGRARTPLSKWVVRLTVIFDLAVLGFFKYLPWLRDQFEFLPFDPLQIVLPLAISFFTFQALGYVIDVGRGEIRPIPLLDFAVYLTFFAHVVAGPIVRVREFSPQLDQQADPRFVQSSEAFLLIFRGLFKKVVVSSYLATQIVDPVFQAPGNYGKAEVLFAILGYAVQIYADFSGYTDIAIGVALLLGIRFPENFDAPYRSLSFQDFWRRWHMTLSRWLRDYLYIPLGGNRGTTERTYLNLFLTMVLGGLWHGANWTFVIWGVIWGGALVIERIVKIAWARRGAIGMPPVVVKVLQWTVTFAVTCVAWVFFRSASFGEAWSVLTQLFTGSENPDIPNVLTPLVMLVVVLAIASQFVPSKLPERAAETFAKAAPVLQILAFAFGLMFIDALGPEGIAPFIYFQF